MLEQNDNAPEQVCWFRKDLPDPLRTRLRQAYHLFYAELQRIDADVSLSKVETRIGPSGRLTVRVPDPDAKYARFFLISRAFLSEIAAAWVDHLVGFTKFRGSKAIAMFQETSEKFVRDFFDSFWQPMTRHFNRDEGTVYWAWTQQIIDQKLSDLQSIWPGRGRRSPKAAVAVNGSPAKEIVELMNGLYKDKKTQLAEDLGIDLKTLNKILRGGIVTERTEDKVSKNLNALGRTK